MLIPYFNVEDLLKIYQLNRAFKAILTPSDPKCLNYKVLCSKWLLSLEYEPEENWREQIQETSQPQVRFCEALKTIKDLFELPTTPIFFSKYP